MPKAENQNRHTDSEPAQQLAIDPMNTFTWKIVSLVKLTIKRKISEGLIIGREQPTLNIEVYCFIAKLFSSRIIEEQN